MQDFYDHQYELMSQELKLPLLVKELETIKAREVKQTSFKISKSKEEQEIYKAIGTMTLLKENLFEKLGCSKKLEGHSNSVDQ